MKLINRKPYLLFWGAIPILLLIGLLDDKAIDISVHDVYFVLSKYHLCVFTAIVFGVLGLGYWLMKFLKRKIINWLTIIHSFLLLGGTLVLIIAPYFYNEYDLADVNVIVTLTTLIIIFAQFFYFVNIILGIFRKETV